MKANQLAISYLVTAGLVFGVSDTLTKLATHSLPISEVLFVRGVATNFCLLAALTACGDLRKLALAAKPLVIGRGVFEMLGAVMYIAAMPHIKLAELSTMALSSPLFLIAFAVIVFGEPVGVRRWCTIVVAVIGVLFVLKPNPDEFNAWAILGVLCALCSAARDLVTRRISGDTPSLAVTLVGSLFITMCGLVAGVGAGWSIPTAEQSIVLISAGIFSGLGIHLSVLSFRGAVELSVVSPFRYAQIAWSGLGGFLLFNELPDAWTMGGAILIVGSGLYALRREAIRNRPLSGVARTGS